jgi:hypothetical protein
MAWTLVFRGLIEYSHRASIKYGLALGFLFDVSVLPMGAADGDASSVLRPVRGGIRAFDSR